VANVSEAFSFGDRTLTGVSIGDIAIDFCKTPTGADVSQAGMTLTELGVGKYSLMNPNITERTVCSGYLTVDSTKSFSLIFNPLDETLATSVGFIHDHTHSLLALALFQNGIFAPMGHMFWIDGDNGNDSNSGTQSAPFATIGKFISVAVDERKDVGLVIAKHTPYDEVVDFTGREHLILLGAGHEAQLSPTNQTGPTILLDGSAEIVISGFGLIEAKNGYHAIDIRDSEAFTINANTISGDLSAGQDGISVMNSKYGRISHNHIHYFGRNGILLDANTSGKVAVEIMDGAIHGCTGNGIQVSGQAANNIIEQAHVYRNGGYGINLGGVDNFCHDCVVVNNATQNIIDTGTTNQFQNNEQWAKQEGLTQFFMRLMASMKNKTIGQ